MKLKNIFITVSLLSLLVIVFSGCSNNGTTEVKSADTVAVIEDNSTNLKIADELRNDYDYTYAHTVKLTELFLVYNAVFDGMPSVAPAHFTNSMITQYNTAIDNYNAALEIFKNSGGVFTPEELKQVEDYLKQVDDTLQSLDLI